MPDEAYPFVDHYHVCYQQWRYKCESCGNIWANKAQREHNDRMFYRAVRDSKGIYG